MESFPQRGPIKNGQPQGQDNLHNIAFQIQSSREVPHLPLKRPTTAPGTAACCSSRVSQEPWANTCRRITNSSTKCAHWATSSTSAVSWPREQMTKRETEINPRETGGLGSIPAQYTVNPDWEDRLRIRGLCKYLCLQELFRNCEM